MLFILIIILVIILTVVCGSNENVWTVKDINAKKRNTKYLQKLEDLETFAEYKKNIIELTKGSILDCACGTGDTLARIDDQKELFGFDINEDSIEIAKTKSNATFKVGSVFDIPFKRKFDTVMIERTLQHFNEFDVKKIINEMKKRVKTGGIIIITEPDWTDVEYQNGNKDVKWRIKKRCQSVVSPKIGSQIKKYLPEAKMMINPLFFNSAEEFVAIFGDIYDKPEGLSGRLMVKTWSINF